MSKVTVESGHVEHGNHGHACCGGHHSKEHSVSSTDKKHAAPAADAKHGAAPQESGQPGGCCGGRAR